MPVTGKLCVRSARANNSLRRQEAWLFADRQTEGQDRTDITTLLHTASFAFTCVDAKKWNGHKLLKMSCNWTVIKGNESQWKHYSATYDCQPHHQRRKSDRRHQEKSCHLHQKPELPHPATTVYLVQRPRDHLAQVTEADHSKHGELIIQTFSVKQYRQESKYGISHLSK